MGDIAQSQEALVGKPLGLTALGSPRRDERMDATVYTTGPI
jgi:hypothetical protein